jgi:hypothetical protein
MELYLAQFSSPGLTLKSRVSDQAGLITPEIAYQVNDIQELLCSLFEYYFGVDLSETHDPRRDIGDSFESKIDLLNKYQGIYQGEQRVLNDILGAIRKIEGRSTHQSGLDFVRDGLWCWYELCTSIYIANEPVLSISPFGHDYLYLLDNRKSDDAVLYGFYHNEYWYLPDWLAVKRARCRSVAIRGPYQARVVQHAST